MQDKRSPSNSPLVESPKYDITVGRDNSLQWDPPPKSKELGYALSYHFPEEATMIEKMQAAIRKWRRDQLEEPLRLTKERKNIIYPDSNSASSGPDLPVNAVHINPEAETKRAALGQSPEFLSPCKRSKIPGVYIWRAEAKDEVVVKPTKRGYSKEERSEVGKNRGKACDYHRRRKQKLSYFMRP